MNLLLRTKPHRRRRAFATLLALWALALIVLVVAALQASAFRQAAAGREALARVRAKWAARAGVEAQIAKLTSNTLSPDTTSAFTITNDLAAVARADLGTASYSIMHAEGPQNVDGPIDAHSRLNINALDTDDLALLDGIDEMLAQSIVNWTQGVDETNPVGADVGAYTGLRYPYDPRGAAARSIRELELVQNMDAHLLRGEDWNLNGRLDPNEDDGDASWPPDNADGVLNAGWSEFLTAVSDGEGLSASGQKRIDLKTATADEVASRLKLDRTQADTLVQYAQNTPTVTLADFVRTTLSDMSSANQASQQAAATQRGRLLTPPQITELTDDQIKAILDEATVGDQTTFGPRRGKLNLNTARRETLERTSKLEPEVLDQILQERDARSSGFLSMMDLTSIEGFDRAAIADLMAYFDVRSNVFVVSSRGRDKATGLEVEIVATLDRSSIPVVIKDLVVR
jgi:DNA uptake protein ComE-like DNA-binding protein